MAGGYGAFMELDPDEAIEDPTDIMARVIAAAEGKVSQRPSLFPLSSFEFHQIESDERDI